MHDSDTDAEYPLHQPGRNGHGRHTPHDDETEYDLEEGPQELRSRPRSRWRGRRPFHQREVPTGPHLPQGPFRKALSIGAIAGILVALQGIIITLANAPIYHTASTTPADKLTLGVAQTLVGLLCLTFFISLLIYFIAGFITGKVAVERRLGFVAGFVAGALSFLLGFLVHYIPGYPDTTASTRGFSGGLISVGTGLVAILVFLLLSGVIAGLVALLGARIATRRHPYYVGYDG